MKNGGKYIIFTDGGSRGNPGPSAIGVVVCDAGGVTYASYAEDAGVGTNNEAEYRAVISALKKTKHILGGEKAKNVEIEVNSDSELLVRQMNAEYKIREDRIKTLFMEIWNLMQDFKRVYFRHIPRDQNIKADGLLNRKLDEIQGKGKLF